MERNRKKIVHLSGGVGKLFTKKARLEVIMNQWEFAGQTSERNILAMRRVYDSIRGMRVFVVVWKWE